MKRSKALEPAAGNRLESAATWLVKLEAVEEAQLTPEELQAWDGWAADEANRAAFDELAALLQQIKPISAVRRPTRSELLADQISDADSGAEGGDPALSSLPARGSAGSKAFFESRRVLALAASVLLAIALPIALRIFNSRPNLTSKIGAVTYRTGTGEQQRITLPDGSVVTMGAASLLHVTYTEQQRNVTLDRGEALFHVVHNFARPFRVLAGDGVITDVGTQFNVLRTAQRVTVTVSEGAVEVARAPPVPADRSAHLARRAALGWPTVQVARGEEISYQPQGQATAVERVDPKLAIAWSRGTLVYDRRPLSEVIDDVTRYWGHQVTLGPGTGELLYSGTVGERHIDAWIRGLPNIFPVSVTEAHGGKVSVRLREH